jgi:xanthine dehydrogenase FAD-binding subunit
MFLTDFDVLAPDSLDEALKMINRFGPDGAMLMAGGTDLLVRMKDNSSQPSKIIILDKIPGLDIIEIFGDSIRIGTAVTFDQILKSDIIKTHAPLLIKAANDVASPQVRARATIGGNIANASPSADSLPPFYVLCAEVVLKSETGERIIPIEKCFSGPKKNIFMRNEMITSIELPIPTQPQNTFFNALGQRKAMAITKLSVAGLLEIGNDDTIKVARIAFGAVAPTVIRGEKVEEYLKGKHLTPDVIEEAARIAEEEVKPITDIRSTKEYRQKISGVLLKRGLESICKNEKESCPDSEKEQKEL